MNIRKGFKKVIFITPLKSDKNIFYFFEYLTIFLALFEKNVFLPVEKLKIPRKELKAVKVAAQHAKLVTFNVKFCVLITLINLARM